MRRRTTSAAALALLLAAWASAAVPEAAQPSRVDGADPPACRRVAAGEPLQALLDAAPPGAAFCLEPGDHAGPVRLAGPVELRGPRDAVIRSLGSGSTVSIDGEGAALIGVSVDGSGGRFDLLDAAVRVHADDARVERVRIRHALFGILVERSNRVRIVDNDVRGDPASPLGMRGDGIRLWEVRESRVEGNRLADSRDLVVWYSPGNVFADNEVVRGRYGTHFMYSHENTVEDCSYVGNVVGIFAMYSRGLRIRRNVIARSGGAAGVGLGLKESGALEVTRNAFLANTVGAYLDTSPLDPAEVNLFDHNAFRLGDAGLVFHGRALGNRFLGNSFRDNHTQVRVEGRGDARDAEWRGNDFDDYRGYDLDGDGIGDVPYELRSLAGELTQRQPALAFLKGSPALGLVELLGHVVPVFRGRTLLVDPAPRMAALDVGTLRGD